MNDLRAEYARLRAVIELRIEELHAALDRHEADPANWARAGVLERVERRLAELAKEVSGT